MSSGCSLQNQERFTAASAAGPLFCGGSAGRVMRWLFSQRGCYYLLWDLAGIAQSILLHLLMFVSVPIQIGSQVPPFKTESPPEQDVEEMA